MLPLVEHHLLLDYMLALSEGRRFRPTRSGAQSSHQTRQSPPVLPAAAGPRRAAGQLGQEGAGGQQRAQSQQQEG